jgi:hypothetical protein
LRFPAPAAWLNAVLVLVVLSAGGVMVALVRRKQARLAIAVAAVPAVIQLVATVTSGVLTGAAPQGRYLFVAAAPLAALLWIGFEEWWPPQSRRFAAPVFVAILLALDITGWITTILPAYV